MERLIKDWFDWCRDNRDKNTTALTALYIWILHKSCELNYPDSFGLPSQDTMHHLATSYNTYKKHLLLLEEIGMIEIVKKAQNQYTSNIIAVSNIDKALTKQVQITSQSNDKASINHLTKQVQITSQSVNKASQYNNNNNNNNSNILYRSFDHLQLTNDEFNKLISEGFKKDEIDDILDSVEAYPKNKSYKSLVAVARKWMNKNRKDKKTNYNNTGVKSNTHVDFKTREHIEHDKRVRSQTQSNKKPSFIYGSQLNQFKKDN